MGLYQRGSVTVATLRRYKETAARLVKLVTAFPGLLRKLPRQCQSGSLVYRGRTYAEASTFIAALLAYWPPKSSAYPLGSRN